MGKTTDWKWKDCQILQCMQPGIYLHSAYEWDETHSNNTIMTPNQKRSHAVEICHYTKPRKFKIQALAGT